MSNHEFNLQEAIRQRDEAMALLRAAVKALNRACKHDDPDNSGLCIKCGVVLEDDGPIWIAEHGFDTD